MADQTVAKPTPSHRHIERERPSPTVNGGTYNNYKMENHMNPLLDRNTQPITDLQAIIDTMFVDTEPAKPLIYVSRIVEHLNKKEKLSSSRNTTRIHSRHGLKPTSPITKPTTTANLAIVMFSCQAQHLSST